MSLFRRAARADSGEKSPPSEPSPRDLPPEARIEVVRAYHRATCHDFHRYAAGPGWLDWANQPDPFRRYAGAELLRLDHSAPEGGAPYASAFREGALEARVLDRSSVSELFEYALGLSAWKEFQGSRWALRIDPSSGNLHPTEGYLIAPAVPGLFDVPSIAHYAPKEHALELRARIPDALWELLARELPPGSFGVALTSIHWREAWKYGERAYRYCQHDAGHALACISLAAGSLGWSARLAEEWGSVELAALLGLRESGLAERESPECLILVTPPSAASARIAAREPSELAAIPFAGRPNVLSTERVDWRAVDLVAEACEKPRTPPEPTLERLEAIDPDALAPAALPHATFRALARRRRSAVEMDGKTGITRAAFYRMLARTHAARGARPFDALPWAPRVSLALFVHRVDELERGLYAFARSAAHRASLASEMRPDFFWEEPPQAPAGLGLFLLARGDVRGRAAAVSCQQEIAGAGAFSLGMLADFEPALAERGAWIYPRLYWECGAIGQVLYLEAEALGLRATGIGCYFDEPVHQVFGLRTPRWRSLYHFTVGGAVEDPRLTSSAPYPAPA